MTEERKADGPKRAFFSPSPGRGERPHLGEASGLAQANCGRLQKTQREVGESSAPWVRVGRGEAGDDRTMAPDYQGKEGISR